MITLAETASYNLFNYIHSICDHYSWSSSAIILFDEDIFIVFPQLDGQQVTAGWFGQGGGLTHLVVIIILMKIFPKGTGHGYHWSILFTFTLIICWLMKKHKDCDLFAPGARRGSHGADIEAKSGKGNLSSFHRRAFLELPLNENKEAGLLQQGSVDIGHVRFKLFLGPLMVSN